MPAAQDRATRYGTYSFHYWRQLAADITDTPQVRCCIGPSAQECRMLCTCKSRSAPGRQGYAPFLHHSAHICQSEASWPVHAYRSGSGMDLPTA